MHTSDNQEGWDSERSSPDWQENGERAPGLLGRSPSSDTLMPAVVCYILCVSASVLYWMYPAGDFLWASGERVFREGEYWRLLTSLFVHADALHLLSNTPLFIIFGWFLRDYFGRSIFPSASLAIGAGVNGAVLLAYEPHVRLMGASGMVYGMVGLWLVLYVRHDSDHAVPARLFRAIGFSLIMLVPTTFQPSVSYLAHGAGFAAGIITALFMSPAVQPGKKST